MKYLVSALILVSMASFNQAHASVETCAERMEKQNWDFTTALLMCAKYGEKTLSCMSDYEERLGWETAFAACRYGRNTANCLTKKLKKYNDLSTAFFICTH